MCMHLFGNLPLAPLELLRLASYCQNATGYTVYTNICEYMYIYSYIEYTFIYTEFALRAAKIAATCFVLPNCYNVHYIYMYICDCYKV